MCDKYIYKVSLFATKKHLKPVYSKYYLTEQETRYIYTNPDVKGVYDDGEIRIFVIKVCDDSKEYKLAFNNNQRYNRAKVNFIINDKIDLDLKG